MAARQPTIIATSIGFQALGPDPRNIRPGPSYLLAAELARAGAHPRVCILTTALGDDDTRLAAVHNAFAKVGMVSSHLALFPMPNVGDIRSHLLAQDVIWVSGGSTANLLALWRLHGLDVVLRECWEAGVVLKGASAGSLCWHIGGTTDSFGPELRPVLDGLAFLPYSNSPHHDAEPQRRPAIHALIAQGVLPDGFATEDGTGLVYFGTEVHEAITEVPDKTAYSLERRGDRVVETALPTRLL
ncbi:MAG TPA: peptidase E [Acidimicrobiales bacterium]|nr:peptidase E [Acidimicrobiales bacterium]